MKAYSYIFKKSMLSFLGALLIISAIDFSFNFFSEIEDINENYSYFDALSYLIATEPYRMRGFIYLAAVVGFLAVKAFKGKRRQHPTLHHGRNHVVKRLNKLN